MMEKRFDVVGIGSMVVETIYRAARIIGPERRILLQRHEDGQMAKQFVGGGTLSHLAWARILGLRVGVFGRQANDENGQLIRQWMQRWGINHHLILDSSSSSFSAVFVDPQGRRVTYLSPGAAAETTAEEIYRHHANYIRQSRLVSAETSQLPLEAIIAVLEIAKADGIPTILDVNVPPSEGLRSLGTCDQLEKALALVDYLKLSKVAALELVARSQKSEARGRRPEAESREQESLACGDLPLTSDLELAQQIRSRYGVRAVILADGERGASIAAAGFSGFIPARQVSVVDSMGAEDAFLGGVIAGLHYGLSWQDIGRLAAACGAACCEITGALPLGPESRQRVLELYDGSPLHPHAVEATTEVSSPQARPFAVATGSGVVIEGPAEVMPLPRRSRGERPYGGAVRRFLDVVINQLERLKQKLAPECFDRAVDLILEAERNRRRVHVTGIGKPEHVANYIASLLSSTGTPAYFLHGADVVHGNSGQVLPGDVVIAISNSGETEEMKAGVSTVRRIGAKVIGVSGNPESWLAKHCDVFLFAGVSEEGDPLNLPPRASVMAEIYVLAALSIALQVQKGLTPQQYNAWHPKGKLGERSAG